MVSIKRFKQAINWTAKILKIECDQYTVFQISFKILMPFVKITTYGMWTLLIPLLSSSQTTLKMKSIKSPNTGFKLDKSGFRIFKLG